MNNRMNGVIVSLVTPFQNDEIREDFLLENLKKLNETPISGYLALGGNGESQSMTHAEQSRILSLIAEQKGEKIVLASVASDSTKVLLEKSKWAADLGADGIRVPCPHYNPKHVSRDVIIRFFLDIAEKTPIPILLYNAPALSGISIAPSTLELLADNPNILGIKDSSLTSLYGYLNIKRKSPDFKIFAGSASFFLPALMAGAAGGDMSLANYLPEACTDLFNYFKTGNIKKAQDLHGRLLAVNTGVSSKWGFPGVKAAMSLLGYYGGEARTPYTLPDKTGIENIKQILTGEGFLT
ncbi:MAG: dihydrodipicolinate synthase family protein [Spirochaetales bacterium]|uniref:Dihydrodipicolinate synthase family protein n=1 Tax=Candidatus Thalassospirochaeta sargassi TaxID=3119039 RepID=A0AAJ1IE46_9SPIO|nr:dihydrodipicolinate synthase family protein [Spirochaetales bacterium]